jgi:hypothetical protein
MKSPACTTKYLILVISLFIFTISSAQDSGQFGFKGGLNVSTLGNTDAGQSAKLGYNLGFHGEKRYYQELGVQAELLISLQGARSTNISDLSLNYTYLSLPVFANLYFSEGAAFELGLQAAYLIRAIQNDGGNKINIRESVNNFDLSGILGLSYSKPFGKIGIRYVLGITNTNGASFTFDSNTKNKVLQIYVSKPLITYE